MSHCAPGAAAEAGRQQRPGTVWLAGLLAPGCSISQAGQAPLSFAGELDVASRTRRKVTCGTLSMPTAERSCWTWRA